MPPTDGDLLQAWRDGSQEAGRALFRRHIGAVSLFFRTKVDDDDREDLIQRTFLACVEAKDRIRQGQRLRAYLLTIARRQLVEHWRRRGRIQRLEDLRGLSVTKLGITPSRLAETRQEERLLLQALRDVSVDHQTVLELYYWQELSVAELAQVLEVAPGTIKSRLARARAALAERLDKVEDAADDAMKRTRPPPADGE